MDLLKLYYLFMIVCGIGILLMGITIICCWVEDVMYEAVRSESWGEPSSYGGLRWGIFVLFCGIAFSVRHGWLLYQCMV